MTEADVKTFAQDLFDWVRRNDVQRFKSELALNRAINAHFGGRSKGQPYPATCYSGTCDVAVPTQPGKFGWVEVKYAQTYFSQQQFRRENYGLFEKWVFCTSPSEHSVRNDLVLKLTKLVGHPTVDFVGMLVIFLYSDLYPMPDNTFARLDAIAPPDIWQKQSAPAWPNPDHRDVPSYVLPVYWERRA